MNVLIIGRFPDGSQPENECFEGRNLKREIVVDNPSDVWGDPIYQGPAWNAPLVLSPGVYHYVYTDEEDWDI